MIKNTGFKLIHRLVSSDDRELVGNTLNLDEVQIRYLATLRTGEAVAWTEHTQKAVLLQVPLSPAKDSQPVSLDQLRRPRTKDPSLVPLSRLRSVVRIQVSGAARGTRNTIPISPWSMHSVESSMR